MKMLRMLVVSAALLPILGGCAAPATQMANNHGQVAQCKTFGFGVIGTLAAVSLYQTCVDQLQKQGYHQVAAKAQVKSPSAAAPASSGQAPPK
jgi:hypothetical protein